MDPTILHLFVYGTLLPRDLRWPLLAPFVVDEGIPDRARGHLFDTGLDYPAATFDAAAPDSATSYVHGRTFTLLGASAGRALEVLDHEEDLVDGLYRRVVITTASELHAWTYAYGAGLDLTPIPTGDWLAHRPPR